MNIFYHKNTFSHTIKYKFRKHFIAKKKNSPHIFHVKTVLTVHVLLLRNFAPVKFQNDFE